MNMKDELGMSVRRAISMAIGSILRTATETTFAAFGATFGVWVALKFLGGLQ